MAAGREPDFIDDPTEWQQRWHDMPALGRENAAIQVGQGKATADPLYAPSARRLALRQRPAVLIWLALPIVAAIGMAVAGLNPEFVAVMTVLLMLYAGGMAAFFQWVSGRPSPATARRLAAWTPTRPTRACRRVEGARLIQALGIFVVSFFIVSLSVRMLILVAVAILAMTGVDVELREPLPPALRALWWPVALVLTWLVYRALLERGQETA